MPTVLQATIGDLAVSVVGMRVLAPDEHFFSLGIDSVQAMQILNLVQDHFGVELDLERVFAEPTLLGISGLVNEQLEARVESMTEDEVALLLRETERER